MARVCTTIELIHRRIHSIRTILATTLMAHPAHHSPPLPLPNTHSFLISHIAIRAFLFSTCTTCCLHTSICLCLPSLYFSYLLAVSFSSFIFLSFVFIFCLFVCLSCFLLFSKRPPRCTAIHNVLALVVLHFS